MVLAGTVVATEQKRSFKAPLLSQDEIFYREVFRQASHHSLMTVISQLQTNETSLGFT